MEKREWMFSSFAVIIAAFAASSEVGASFGKGVELRAAASGLPPGTGVVEREGMFEEGISVSSSTRALAVDLWLDKPEKLGRMFTGIMTTFLNDDIKSFLSACRLMLDIRKVSVDAVCSDNALSHCSTSESAFCLSDASSSARYRSRCGSKILDKTAICSL